MFGIYEALSLRELLRQEFPSVLPWLVFLNMTVININGIGPSGGRCHVISPRKPLVEAF